VKSIKAPNSRHATTANTAGSNAKISRVDSTCYLSLGFPLVSNIALLLQLALAGTVVGRARPPEQPQGVLAAAYVARLRVPIYGNVEGTRVVGAVVRGTRAG
jgi:hypothetical protein